MPVAIAGLAVVIVAVVALILLYAYYQLLHPLMQGIASRGGPLGGAIGTVIDAILSYAYHTAFGWARQAVYGIIALIIAPVLWIEQHVWMVIDVFRSITAAIAWTQTYLIPSTAADILSTVRGWVTQATDYAASLTRGLAAWTASQLTALQHDLTAGLAAESAYIQSTTGALAGDLAAGLAAESAYAQHLAAEGVAYTQAAVADLGITVTGDLTRVTSWVQSQVTALDAYIALTGAQTLALTLDAVGTVEGDLGRLKAECTDNLCANLGPLASAISAFEGAAGITALIAFIGAAVGDPRGTGDVMAEVIAPVAIGAADLLRAVIGA